MPQVFWTTLVVRLVGMRVESGVESGVDSGVIVGGYCLTLGLVPWLVVHCSVGFRPVVGALKG